MEVLVVMGAAVRPDDTPSRALRRRIELAAAHARARPALRLLVTGGCHPWHPTSEAEHMARGLERAGVAGQRIWLEPESRDTLASVRRCAALLAEREIRRAAICSHRYHLPRTRLLFRLHGIETVGLPVVSGWRSEGTGPYLKARGREIVGLPLDVALALAARGRGR